jgi:hypothetical protein
MTKVVEWNVKQHELPIQEEPERTKAGPGRNFEDPKIGSKREPLLQIPENEIGIVPEVAQKDVGPDVLGFALVAMPVNGNEVHSVTVGVRTIAVSLVVLVMKHLVELLRKAHCHGQNPAEDPIQGRRLEIGIVNEIVGDAIDIPGDADGINESKH